MPTLDTVRKGLVTPSVAKGRLGVGGGGGGGLFYTDFSEYPSGQAPEDWLNRWVTGLSTIEVQDDEALTGGKYLRNIQPAQNDYQAFTWETPGDFVDIGALSRMRVTTSVGHGNQLGIAARVSGGADAENGILFSPYFDTMTIRELSNGSAFTRSQVAYSRPGASWFWMRLEVIGNMCRGRFWLDTDPEPSEWTLSYTGLTYLTAGKVGFQTYGWDSDKIIDTFQLYTPEE